MNLVRWDSLRELQDMTGRLNRLIAGAVLQPAEDETLAVPDWVPSVDIVETPDEYRIAMDLPDVQAENVEGERREPPAPHRR